MNTVGNGTPPAAPDTPPLAPKSGTPPAATVPDPRRPVPGEDTPPASPTAPPGPDQGSGAVDAGGDGASFAQVGRRAAPADRKSVV